MLELEEARERIFALLVPLGSEKVSVSDCAERIVFSDIAAPLDLPLFDSSAMDGFALRASDIAAASRDKPKELKLVGSIAAGTAPASAVEPGTCIRVFTGSALPKGADAVIMQEDTTAASHNPFCILCFDAVKPWEHIRLRGEDVKTGTVVTQRGDRLGPGNLALLSALGLGQIEVCCKPLVGLVATGSELIEPGEHLEPGTIYESNRSMLGRLVYQAGAITRRYPLVPDTLQQTRLALERAFGECDVVVTSGGASVGEHDLVKKAIEVMGGQLQFWRVAIKPGKPFVLGRLGNKLLFGLPGNPVSAFVTFLLLVRPALLRLQGAKDVDLPSHAGELIEPLVNRGDRRHFLRVQVDDKGKVRSAGVQASHVLSSLSMANGLVELPPDTTLPGGAIVKVLRWQF